MTEKDWLVFVKEKIKNYSEESITFTKIKLIEWLCKRNNSTVEEMKNEIINLKSITHVEKQEVEHEGQAQERFRCYFVYSRNKGRCYVLKFNHEVKIVTAFPLGRTTLKRYRKRFK